MYFTILIIASIAYALQAYFVAKYSRKISAYSMVLYRGLALGITMLPLLFLGFQDIVYIKDYAHLILIASITGFLGNYFTNLGFRTLPVGISSGIKMGFNILFSSIFGYLFLAEVLPLSTIVFIFCIIFGIILIKFSKIDINHLHDGHIFKGFIYSILAGIFLSYAFYTVTVIARDFSPYLGAYFWELGIGLVALVYSLIGKLFKKPFNKVSLKQFKKIMFVTSPTFIGTFGYLIAVQYIPIGVASSVLSANIIVLTLLSYFFMKENINIIQIVGILIVLFSVIAIKLFNF